MQLVAEASDDDDDDSETGFKLHASSASSEDMFFARRASILDFDLQRHGVGGLGSKSQRQLQRALLSRSLYEGSRQKLGMQHERGLLLYGAPGCGKSLIAGAIGKLLHATSVQYITAADLDSKWFGENGQRVKALFHPGSESKKVGRLADLRLVVVELDGLAGQDRADRPEISRQADESALNLNVLLASLDDFEEEDQTLVVGLTSRKDKIDPALLRPGRLGVHIEVTVPDAAGRLEILKIHTATLFSNNFLAPDVSLESLVQNTHGFSGADVAQVVSGAIALSLLDAPDFVRSGDVPVRFIGQASFDQALAELGPCQEPHNDANKYSGLSQGFTSTSDPKASFAISIFKLCKAVYHMQRQSGNSFVACFRFMTDDGLSQGFTFTSDPKASFPISIFKLCKAVYHLQRQSGNSFVACFRFMTDV
ncbi:unnamed protein product [Polarella glacialis]|uniref:Vesicle-fusing ATPase n=1 Tax=Polarella glacialis TaxID=89957 RepID=A0A813KMW2_POLGL|nr:unnamed protein product [Polarella glacialis]